MNNFATKFFQVSDFYWLIFVGLANNIVAKILLVACWNKKKFFAPYQLEKKKIFTKKNCTKRSVEETASISFSFTLFLSHSLSLSLSPSHSLSFSLSHTHSLSLTPAIIPLGLVDGAKYEAQLGHNLKIIFSQAFENC